MTPGTTWTGPDGTAYLVVEPGDVREGEARWWVFEPIEADWPRTPSDMHDDPLEPGLPKICMVI